MTTSTFSQKLLERLSLVDKEQLERLLSVMVEERRLLSLILEAMSDGILVTGAEDQLLFANRAAQSLLLEKGQDFVGIKINELAFDASLLQALRESEAKGESVQIRLERPRNAWVEVISFPLGDSPDSMRGTLYVLRDETRRRRILDATAREAHIASLGALAAGLAHEIRNPLNALYIHTQLAQRELESETSSPTETLTKELEIISDAVTQLEAIVHCFLDAARPRKVDRRARNIHALLETSLTLLMPEIEGNGVQLTKRYDRNIPDLLIDAVQFQEVVTNLVRNAVQAMPSGGDLAIRTWQDGKGIIRIEFEDTGCGIPEEFLPRIFAPYSTTKKRGTGLGLFLVHRIVREHHGEIEVSSEEGKGTRISILLPRSLCEAKFLPHEQQFFS